MKKQKQQKIKENKNPDKPPKKITHYLKSGGKTFGIGAKIFIGALITAFLLTIIFVIGTYLNYAEDFKQLEPRNNTTKNVFLDSAGEVIYESFGTAEPQNIELQKVPQTIRDATLASEDLDFYEHGAVDFKGLMRAAYQNFQSTEGSITEKVAGLFSEENYSQGGSTITQQLVKNIYLTNERSFDRKIKEVVYAYEMERKYEKDEIFEMYLNNVYFGEQSLGIVNAAETYYGKKIDELDLAEISMLVGLPQAPSRLSPISGNFEAAKERQRYVLSQMYFGDMITLKEAKEAAASDLYLTSGPKESVLKYPYFVNYAKQEVKRIVGDEAYNAGGLVVHTTLDSSMEDTVEAESKEHLKTLERRNVSNAAAVVLDNDSGNILAMMGGVDPETSKVNVATSRRQPGSSFKPIVYTAGLLEGYSAATILWDSGVSFGGTPPYRPRNYDGRYRGYVTMRRALANSLNVPAVEMTQLVGVDKVIETAQKLGIDSIDTERYYGLSIGLGSAEVKLLDMARAYSTLANLGEKPHLTAINKIVDAKGADIYLNSKYKERAIDEKVAYIMTNILSDNNARREVFGSYSDLQLGDRPVAAKTGTTDSYSDAWTMGYTPQYTVGVWVGNNDHSEMRSVPGLDGAAPIWNGIMQSIHQGKKILNFKEPEGLTKVWVNPYTGREASYKGRPNIEEIFVPGTEKDLNEDLSYLGIFR